MIQYDHEEHPVQVTGAGNVAIATRDSERAVEFYRWVFGFRLAPEAGGGGRPRVLMHGRGGMCLAICEQRGVMAGSERLLFAAADLDEARARLWDLGIALADGCVEPRFDPEHRCRSLRVHDPDGNEIELVETPVAFAPRESRAETISVAGR